MHDAGSMFFIEFPRFTISVDLLVVVVSAYIYICTRDDDIRVTTVSFLLQRILLLRILWFDHRVAVLSIFYPCGILLYSVP
jgi:hypothetical protein